MIVAVNNTYIDLENFKIAEPTAKAIPLTSGTIFRKVKPAMKLKRKVKNIWIASQKLSLEYLMACHMIETGKEKVACFIKFSDEKYFVMEFVINQTPMSIKCSETFIRESPSDYIEIENKVFDEILGNVSIASAVIDTKALLKYSKASFDLGPQNIAVLAIGIAIIAGSLFFTIKMIFPPKKTAPAVTQQQMAAPPPLTEDEKKKLNYAVLKEFVEKYNNIVRTKNPDTVLNSLKLTVQESDQSVKGDLYLEFRSYYPYIGATLITDRDVNLYQWTENVPIEKKRDDIKEGLPDNQLQCLKKAIDGSWIVSKREKDRWYMTLEEKDYKHFISKVNSLTNCPVAVKSLEMTGDKYRCDLVLNFLKS